MDAIELAGRRWAAIAGALAVALVFAWFFADPGAARAIHGPGHKSAGRYSGACQINGAARGYSPPLSDKPASRTFVFHGAGTCTGELLGSDKTTTIPVKTVIRGHTTVDGCAGFGITEQAPGELYGIGTPAARRIRVSFHTDVLIDGVTVTTATVGDHGGAALGTGQILPNAATIAGCKRGNLEILRFSLSMHTVTPFVLDPAG